MRVLAALLALFLIALPAPAAETINSIAQVQALVASERNPRSWKTLWLRPGSYRYLYYQWILEDGTTVTKVETTLLGRSIPDQRPLAQSHPNVWFIIQAAQTIAPVVTSGFLATKL